MNLRLADFSVLSESEGLRTEKRAFFPATWGASHLPVTLMVSKDMALNNINVKNSFALTPIAQFVDQVPSYLVSPSPGQSNTGSMQGKHPNHVKYFHPSPTFSSSPPRRLHLFATCGLVPRGLKLGQGLLTAAPVSLALARVAQTLTCLPSPPTSKHSSSSPSPLSSPPSSSSPSSSSSLFPVPLTVLSFPQLWFGLSSVSKFSSSAPSPRT